MHATHARQSEHKIQSRDGPLHLTLTPGAYVWWYVGCVARGLCGMWAVWHVG